MSGVAVALLIVPSTLAVIWPSGRKASCGLPKVWSVGVVELRDRLVRRGEDRVGHVARDEGRDLPVGLGRRGRDRDRRGRAARLAEVLLRSVETRPARPWL